MSAMGDLPEEMLLQCMRCGFCLPACPTYRHLEVETHSPRGRIALVRAATSGRIDPQTHLKQPIALCLGCRACEPVCPAGVRYGGILEGARALIREHSRSRGVRGWLEYLLLSRVIPDIRWMRRLGGWLWLYRALGLARLARTLGLLRFLPASIRAFETVLYDLAPPGERLEFGKTYGPAGPPRGKVALLAGCVGEALFHRTNRSTVRLLRAAGYQVTMPANQTCCGALHAHAGELEKSRALARQNIASFEHSGADLYLTNAGGCGAALKEYPALLAHDPAWAARAAAFSARVRDVSEVLFEADLPAFRTVAVQATYQDSCHLANVQGVREQPRRLLRRMPGLRLVEMAESDRCCGAAGTYSLLHFDVSMGILAEKMARVAQTNASLIVTGNPGCLLQLRLGIRRARLEGKVRAEHLVDVVAAHCEHLADL